MTFNEFDPLQICPYTKNELSTSQLSTIIVLQTCRCTQTDAITTPTRKMLRVAGKTTRSRYGESLRIGQMRFKRLLKDGALITVGGRSLRLVTQPDDADTGRA